MRARGGWWLAVAAVLLVVALLLVGKAASDGRASQDERFLACLTRLDRDHLQAGFTRSLKPNGICQRGSLAFNSAGRVPIDSANVEKGNYQSRVAPWKGASGYVIPFDIHFDPFSEGLFLWEEGRRVSPISAGLFTCREQHGLSVIGSGYESARHCGDADASCGSVPSIFDANSYPEVGASRIESNRTDNSGIKSYPSSVASQSGIKLTLDGDRLPYIGSQYGAGYDRIGREPAGRFLLACLIFWPLSVCLGVFCFILLEHSFKRPLDTGAVTDFAVIGLALLSGAMFVLAFAVGL